MSSKKQEEWDKEIPKASFTRLLKANAPEWWLIAIGVLAAMGNGSVFPIYSILFGEVLREFQKPPSDVLDGITPWAATFLALAAGSAIAIFFKVSCQHGMAGRVLQWRCLERCTDLRLTDVSLLERSSFQRVDV